MDILVRKTLSQAALWKKCLQAQHSKGKLNIVKQWIVNKGSL
jgi:hypothetical protein